MSYILDNKDFLNKNGYLIIQDKNVKEICNKVYDKIKIESNKARFIFNGKTNDKKRKQCVLNSKSAIIKKYKLFIKKTIENNLDINNLNFRGWNIIKSLKGCQMQQPHIDYIPTNTFIKTIKENENELPYFFISAIEKTQLYVWGKFLDNEHKFKKIIIESGDILIIRGDVIHAGSDFIENENIRIHCYLDSKTIPRTLNKIFKIDSLSMN